MSSATWVTYERERRGWKASTLAHKMTELGCPVATSSVDKMEGSHQDHPRKVSAAELMALVRLFGLPVEELFVGPEISANGEARRMVEMIVDAHNRAVDAYEQMTAACGALAALLTQHPDIAEALDPDVRDYLIDMEELAGLLFPKRHDSDEKADRGER